MWNPEVQTCLDLLTTPQSAGVAEASRGKGGQGESSVCTSERSDARKMEIPLTALGAKPPLGARLRFGHKDLSFKFLQILSRLLRSLVMYRSKI